jgi:hypothetical protein
VEARQINWANLPFTTNLTSQGIPLDARFVFELGTFESGFAPTTDNLAEWAAHWRVANRVTYDPGNAFVSGSYTELNHFPSFEPGEQGYLWGYLDTEDTRGEWILVTDATWLWPESDTLAFPLSWIFDVTNTQIVGSVDEDGNLTTARVTEIPRPRISGPRWLSTFFSSAEQQDARISGWRSDPDGDGLSNLREMALGTHPRVIDLPAPEITTTLVDEEGKAFVEVTVTRRPDRLVDYIIESSENQLDWTPMLTQGTLIEDSLYRLTVRDAVPLGTVTRRFVRLTLRLQ